MKNDFEITAKPSQEAIDWYRDQVNDALAKHYAKKIVIARVEEAKKRGEYHGGERRKRGPAR